LSLKPLVFLLLAALIYSAPIEAQTPGRKPDYEQTLFSAEDESPERPVKLSDGVLELLRKDEQVLRYLAVAQKSADELTTESFLASEVHLDGPTEVDLIVMGDGRLRGANVATFWIFRKLPEGYRLVFKIATFGLTVERSRWKGLRNISIASPIAGYSVENFFRFNGEKYEHFRTKSELIK
jgi:hypothetical protein